MATRRRSGPAGSPPPDDRPDRRRGRWTDGAAGFAILVALFAVALVVAAVVAIALTRLGV